MVCRTTVSCPSLPQLTGRIATVLFLIGTLLTFSINVHAQTTSTQQQQQPPTPPVEEKPKQQTPTRSTAFAASGDSAAGSIGGIRTPESIKVSSGGAATYSIPITVPPGTAGVAPKLAFNYNSQGENSLLGVGWSVSGLPVIHRCGATYAQDGFKGGVNYDGNDRFCLDGARLMAINGTYGGDGTGYRTEVNAFLKVLSYGTVPGGSGPAYFQVWMKSGELMEFGNTADSRIEAQGKSSVRVWALNKVQDTKGNYLTVTYTEDGVTGEFRPARIDYTANSAGGLNAGRSVQFFYANRPDIYPLYIGGSLIKTTVRLTNVKTYLGATLVRDYQLQYETGTATGRSRLTRITECTSSCTAPNGLPPNVFTWQEGGNGTYVKYANAINGSQFDKPSTWQGDYNGDGKADLASYTNGTIYTYRSNGNGTFQTPVAQSIDTTKWEKTRVWAGDYDGDGKTDLATYTNATIYTYRSNPNGNGTYLLLTAQSVSTSEFDATYVWPGDYNGDGRVDLATYKNSNIITYLSKGDGTYHKLIQAVSSAEFDAIYTWSGDYNGDGKGDLFTIKNFTTIYTYLSNLVLNPSTNQTTGTYQKVVQAAPQTTSWGDVRPGDYNGDGRTDLASFWPFEQGHDASIQTLLSSGDGTYQNLVQFTVFADYNGTNSWAGDYNGDGKTDLASKVGSTIFTYISKGDGTYQKVAHAINTSEFDPANVWPGDYSGDGKADLATQNNQTIYSYYANGLYPDLAKIITNIFGGTNTLTYKPITDNTIYAKDTGAVYPKIDLQYPLYVVTNLVVSDAVQSTYNFSYKYGGARADHLRGAEGFRWMEVTDTSANSRTTTFYNQSFPLTGLPISIEIDRSSDLASFRDSIHAYLVNYPYPQAPTVAFVGLSQLDVKEWEGGGTYRLITTTFEYDSFTFGNLSRRWRQGVAGTADDSDERTEWV